jgi:hypothetical protein
MIKDIITYSCPCKIVLAQPVFAGSPDQANARKSGLGIVAVVGRPFHTPCPERAEALRAARAPAGNRPSKQGDQERSGRQRESEPVPHVVRHWGVGRFFSCAANKKPAVRRVGVLSVQRPQDINLQARFYAVSSRAGISHLREHLHQ